MKRTLTALAAALFVLPAAAQTYTRQATPDPGQYMPVFVQACFDAQNRAIPPGPGCASGSPTTANQGAPNTAANAWPTYLTQGGTALSSTNPTFVQLTPGMAAVGTVAQGAPGAAPWLSTVYQGGAALSGTNPLFAQLTPGNALVGKVGIDQTTPGTTNGVVVNSSALPAGAATLAAQQAVQSAPGTAANTAEGVQGVTGGVPIPIQGGNSAAVKVDGSAVTQPVNNAGTFAVQNTAPTPAGSAVIGKVDIDQATPGTTNGVQVNASALPAGAATSALQSAVQSAPGSAAGTAITVQGAANGVPQPIQGGNSTAVKTDSSATTQPVSATSLPLPTGASTLAGQQAVQAAPGTSAGTAQGVQGVTGGVPIAATLTNPAPSTVTANQGTAGSQAWPVSQASQPLPTGAATAANQTNTQAAAGTSAGTASAVQGVSGGVPVPVSNASLPLPAGASTSALQSNVQAAPGTSATTAQGVQGVTGGLPVIVQQANDGAPPAGNPFSATATGTLFSLDTAGSNSIVVQISGTFSAAFVFEGSNDNTIWSPVYGDLPGAATASGGGSSPQIVTFPPGTRYLRVRVSSYTSGTVNAAVVMRTSPTPPRLTSITNNPSVTPSTSASGGGVPSFSRIVSSAATTNATVAKAGNGRLYKVFACNTSTSAAFIRFYNTGTAPTPGTTTVLFSRPIPPAAAAGGLNCASYDMSDLGWYFSAGISYAVTAGNADNDTTALTAGQVTQLSVEFQ